MNGIVFISLVLNFVCLYFIRFLWKKIEQNNVKSESTENIEELLELFSQEMRDENERLHKLISDFRKKYEQHIRISSDKENDTSSEAIKNISLNEVNNDEKHIDPETHSETKKVISLAKQGFNAEQIAKMLNRGKGEIELLLKFYA